MTALKNSRTKHLEIRKYSQFVSIDVDRLTFAGEYSAGGSVDFFIRVDEAVFDLSYEQFYSFWKEISRAKKIWHTIRERRT